jgi:hypothetical protein
MAILVFIWVVWEARIKGNGGFLENAGVENIVYNIGAAIGFSLLLNGALKTLSSWWLAIPQHAQVSQSESEGHQVTSAATNELQNGNLYSKACDEIGIEGNASVDEIRTHWRRNCSRWHPDHGGSHDTWIRKKIAYDMLIACAEHGK